MVPITGIVVLLKSYRLRKVNDMQNCRTLLLLIINTSKEHSFKENRNHFTTIITVNLTATATECSSAATRQSALFFCFFDCSKSESHYWFLQSAPETPADTAVKGVFFFECFECCSRRPPVTYTLSLSTTTALYRHGQRVLPWIVRCCCSFTIPFPDPSLTVIFFSVSFGTRVCLVFRPLPPLSFLMPCSC